MGGLDTPILVVLSSFSQAVNSSFQRLTLGSANFLRKVHAVGKLKDLCEQVAANPDAIGFVTGPFLNDTVKTLQTEEISSPLIMVTKGVPSPKIQKLIDYIAGDGREYVIE